MRQKIAFITGITGQDGSLLAKFLLKKNYIVHGLKEEHPHLIQKLDSIYEDHQVKSRKLILHYGDLIDSYLY